MTSPFTAIIVDDEPGAVERVRRLCAASPLVTVVGEAADGPSALALIARCAPRAVFLDIAMPGINGLAVAASLRAAARDGGASPHVVLVTANCNYATEAFDLSVVDYVLKPIDPDRLARAIERVATLVARDAPDQADESALWLPYRGSVVRVPIAEIQRVEAERDYVRVHDATRSFLFRTTLAEIVDRLGDRFIRIHRSTVIARDRVTGLRHTGGGRWLAIDPDRRELPIGRTYLLDLRAALQLHD